MKSFLPLIVFIVFTSTLCAQETQILNTLPGAYAKKPKTEKPNYLCELRFKNGEIIQLESLNTFSGNANDVSSVYLMYMSLETVPADLARFKNIERLFLSHNNFTALDSDFLKQFKQLKKLYLNGNNLEPAYIAQLKSALPNVDIIASNEGNPNE